MTDPSVVERVRKFVAVKKTGKGYVAALSKVYPTDRPWDAVESAFYADLQALLQAFEGGGSSSARSLPQQPVAGRHGSEEGPAPSGVHAPDCQSHIVDVRGHPDECTCGAEQAAVERVLIAPDDLQQLIRIAYVAGCNDVHANWQEDADPDFTEASYDYVASVDFTETTKPYRGAP